jgi:hypothetical protein
VTDPKPQATPEAPRKPESPIAAEPLRATTLGDTNGQLAAAANETAAQAKSAIESAGDSLARPSAPSGSTTTRVSVALALVVSLLALLLIRRLRQAGRKDNEYTRVPDE